MPVDVHGCGAYHIAFIIRGHIRSGISGQIMALHLWFSIVHFGIQSMRATDACIQLRTACVQYVGWPAHMCWYDCHMTSQLVGAVGGTGIGRS